MILNHYDKSIANLAFWIENPELVTRLHSIEHGTITPSISEKREGNVITKSSMFYTIPSEAQTIDTLLDKYFGVHNAKDYLKFYYRYVKTYCNEMGLDDDQYFLSLIEIKHLLSLPAGKYNMDAIVSTCQDGLAYVKEVGYWYDTDLRKTLFFSWIEDFAIKTESFEPYIKAAMVKYPDKLGAYRKGNANLFNMFFGEVMKSLPSKNVDKVALSAEIKGLLDGEG